MPRRKNQLTQSSRTATTDCLARALPASGRALFLHSGGRREAGAGRGRPCRVCDGGGSCGGKPPWPGHDARSCRLPGRSSASGPGKAGCRTGARRPDTCAGRRKGAGSSAPGRRPGSIGANPPAGRPSPDGDSRRSGLLRESYLCISALFAQIPVILADNCATPPMSHKILPPTVPSGAASIRSKHRFTASSSQSPGLDGTW